jgi:hypothetical protein
MQNVVVAHDMPRSAPVEVAAPDGTLHAVPFHWISVACAALGVGPEKLRSAAQKLVPTQETARYSAWYPGGAAGVGSVVNVEPFHR